MATHRCPGLCGRTVANARYACLHCWGRLPIELRAMIIDTSHLGTLEARRREALGASGEWYREHPVSPEGAL